MRIRHWLGLALVGLAIVPGARTLAQAKTEVPPVVPGAKPVTVEHIKVHAPLSKET
jgi:hypothetical protein